MTYLLTAVTLPWSMKDQWYGPLSSSFVRMGRDREEEKGSEEWKKSEEGIRRKVHERVVGHSAQHDEHGPFLLLPMHSISLVIYL